MTHDDEHEEEDLRRRQHRRKYGDEHKRETTATTSINAIWITGTHTRSVRNTKCQHTPAKRTKREVPARRPCEERRR